MKTHWKKLTNPDYIGAYALNPGEDLVVQIKQVTHEQITGADGKKDECNVAHLVGHKPFILNSTNQKSIEKALKSPYIEDWAGKYSQLYVARVKAFGDVVDALRVRLTAPEPPKRAKESLTPDHPQWAKAKAAILGGSTTVETIRQHYVISPENEALILSE
jgi:hypothetical protein